MRLHDRLAKMKYDMQKSIDRLVDNDIVAAEQMMANADREINAIRAEIAEIDAVLAPPPKQATAEEVYVKSLSGSDTARDPDFDEVRGLPATPVRLTVQYSDGDITIHTVIPGEKFELPLRK